MNKEYWHQAWQFHDIEFDQSQPHKIMQRYFSSLNLNAGCRVFVPLCGQSIDMLWLANQGYQVVGVELSHIACDAFFTIHRIPVNVTNVNDFMVYSSSNITIFCGDFFKLHQSMLGQIDAVYDRAALIALPQDMRRLYVRHLNELAMPNVSSIFLITTVYDQNEMQGPPFSVNEHEVIVRYGTAFDVNRIYSKQFDIPTHLRAKGLRQAAEQVYALIKRT